MNHTYRSSSAYAKINIGLALLGKRADGYHEIETIFQQISICDTLHFARQEQGIALTCSDPGLPLDEGNLVFRAARLLQQRGEITSGCQIHLEKRIPMGAGLGGGSSDAATTLRVLNRMWQLHWPAETLTDLAAQLGSDVPFFIRGGAAWGRGRGEILEALQMPDNYWGVLIYPHIVVSTRWVYENVNFDLTKTLKNSKFYSLTSFVNQLDLWDIHFKNDLEYVVFNRYPQLALLVDRFRRQGAFYARMSGSGSAVFGLFSEKKAALRALESSDKSMYCHLFHPVPAHRA